MVDRRRVAAVAALLGLLTGLVAGGTSFLPVILDRTGGLKLAGTAFSFAAFLLSPVAVVASGYWVGKDADVASEYRRLALVIGIAGGAGFLVGYLGIAFGAAGDAVRGAVHVVLFPALYSAAVQGVEFGVAGLAGAAVAEFRGA